MATRGRPPGQGKVPGSGRKKGSLSKGERQVISEKLAFDVIKTYKRLGPDWLFELAKTRPDLFLSQCLTRMLPPAFKEDPDVQFNQQVNIGLSEFEAARRVAFALSKAVYESPAIEAEVTPQEAYPAPRWQAPDIVPPLPQPEPDVPDPDRERWIEELPLTPEQRRDNALVRETQTATLATYRGGTAEQGGPGPVRQSGRKLTAAELCRRRNRRDDLL